MKLEGSCHCGAVRFSVMSHTPYPFMRCYCSICRKTAGGGGYAINIMGNTATFESKGRTRIYRATRGGRPRRNPPSTVISWPVIITAPSISQAAASAISSGVQTRPRAAAAAN